MSDALRTEIEAHLSGYMGRPLRVEASTGSTNTDATGWAKAGAPEGAVVVADHQTEGRGRWGRGWYAPPGRALLFSLVLRPRLEPRGLGILTTMMGLACAEAIEDRTGLPVQLKWPNDLLAHGRKLGGILFESNLSGAAVDFVVAGVGINTHLEAEELPAELAPSATSLVIAGAASVPTRPELLGAILGRFEALYRSVGGHHWAENLAAKATERSSVIGHQVDIAGPDGSVSTATATRLLSSGALEVEAGGEVVVLDVGEVQRVRPHV